MQALRGSSSKKQGTGTRSYLLGEIFLEFEIPGNQENAGCTLQFFSAEAELRAPLEASCECSGNSKGPSALTSVLLEFWHVDGG